ncbi:arp2/3 complex-activating protein rickA isoform X2 [Biomphalaria pfeifferi]|uniref:Arp2/3 complex-activating protein rickA isoform X2 n=1 Tax=Biomphalaria pfeifferi TaxID=112525 RepID=A0AAD8AT18_BIOPF|nr:arp2/3 complex-activating protein rickA isoform X2 [Biomphalaria pfeifferi]
MDKAARVVRRSGVKLMSLGGGHTDLHVLLSEVKDMRNTAKSFMNVQNAVSQDFLKWAISEENRALQDVANQLAELNLLWTEVQREFGEHLKEYRYMFEMILEGEKHVSQSKNNFNACEQREMKVRKELKKAFKKSSPAEIQALELRLSQAERAKDLAQIEVTDRIRENEAVKLIRLKEGLMKLSLAYSDFARKCSVVFDAQQEIVLQLPDVHDQDLEDIKYTGSGVTRFKVQQAKEKVRNYRRHSRDHFPLQQKCSEPPPPYTTSDQYDSSVHSSLTTSPRRRISSACESQPALDTATTTLPHAKASAIFQPVTSPPVAIISAPERPADAIITMPPLGLPLPSGLVSPPCMELPAPAHLPRDDHSVVPPNSMAASNLIAPADGLVDLNPNWDNSYEEDLSGAMGGTKI